MASPNSYIGYALVVNVKYFEDPDNNREETLSDQSNASAAFRKLGFNTKLVTETVLTDSTVINVTVKHFKQEYEKALQHVNEQRYGHFAVFISTHGEEVRVGDHYIHKLSFYDGDESTEEILFKPLDKKLNRKVKKLVIIQACRCREDQSEGEDEDQGVLVEDQEEEYQSSEDDSPPLTEAETVHCVPLCIPNCIIMFASPSGKVAYQRLLGELLFMTVRTFKSGEDVNVLDLMRKVNRQFTEMDIDREYDDENGCRISYDVKNIGSIVHCLTEHIVYPITK